MTIWLAQIIVGVVATYALIGVLFALWLIAFGLGRLDAAAQHAGWGLRWLLLPGAAAFWPWLWRRVRQ
jgi:hypothetical protein